MTLQRVARELIADIARVRETPGATVLPPTPEPVAAPAGWR
ncbi:MAG TPA: hypothetical protein VFS44_11100 [Gemmatimonadaceae bacterium]|nr:hypothetical protein [Gemmatimonadaceae bacterium]